MKKIILILATMLPLVLIHQFAEAARLGGGRSVGRSYSAPASPSATRPAATNPNNTAAAPSRPSGLTGILGGALLGLGLGALFSALGMSAGFANIISTILLVVLIFFAFSFLMRYLAKRRQPMAYQGAGANSAAEPRSYQAYSNDSRGTPVIGSALGGEASVGVWNIPADFDSIGFLTQAKQRFIEMQKAWDDADLSTIASFTTDEMLIAIKNMLAERGDQPNHTEVLSVNTNLLGILEESDHYVASVKLVGTIDEGQGASGFAEIWYWVKPRNNGGWLLSGIEQS